MLSYAFKRVIRSWKLFAALLLGTVLASTFFAGINIGADTAAKQALDQRLSQVPVDIVVGPSGYGPEQGVLSSANFTEIADVISGSGIEGVTDAEVISRAWYVDTQLPGSNETIPFRLIGISNNSHVYDGLTVINGSTSLLENETYVWADSKDAGSLKIGDVLQINFSIWAYRGYEIPKESEITLTLNLTVAGFVHLDDQAFSIASGEYYYYDGPYFGPGVISPFRPTLERRFEANILISSWENTSAGLLDSISALSLEYTIDTHILVYLDRESLISPWDIGGSIEKLNTVTSRIENEVSSHGFYYVYTSNHLVNTLKTYQFMATAMRFTFLVTALPVFFVAWYMGMTVSDVALNLRRREIGLLLTKGFSRGQLLRMFLGEAALIGLMGGVIGIILSLLLNPLFVRATGGAFSGIPAIGPDTIILILVFSVSITFLSVFQPARRASRLNAVDALREYRYVEEVKPYKRRWPLIAFFLGTYKIVILLLGVNMVTLMMRFPPTNIIIGILMVIAMVLDGVLNYVGPLLFFWGFTKIFIRGSLKFQELTAKAARFLGDLGSLTTRNVQRNPARTASVAFLIALIIGYGIQVTGSLASEQDYVVREIYFNVGADISVSLNSPVNASTTMNEIGNLSGVLSTVVEYSFWGESSWGGLSLKAVNPETWLDTAYYESGWFTGSDVETAFHSLALDNDAIILERGIAMTSLDVGDKITLDFGQSRYSLRIVGFFGTEPPEAPIIGIPEGPGYIWRQYWSYIPEDLYHELSANVSASAKGLVKLEAGADGEAVADQIRGLESDNIGWVYSVAEQLQEQQTNVLFSGPMNVQRLGVVFALLAASVGTALVTLVSLKERSKEISLMSVRGLSFKQLAVMLLTENLAVVVFAVLLGGVVGLIIVRGNVAATNAAAFSLVTHRVVFPMGSFLTLAVCFFLVFASTIIPVVTVARRYVSRLERMVREA